MNRSWPGGALVELPRRVWVAAILIVAVLLCHGALGSAHQLSAYSGSGAEHGASYETSLHPDSLGHGVAGTTYYATSLLALGVLGVALGLLARAGYRPLWVSLVRPRVLRLVERSLLRPPGPPPSLARLQVFRI